MGKLHTVVNKSPGFNIMRIILVDAVICGARKIQNRAVVCVYSKGSLHEDQMMLTQTGHRNDIMSRICDSLLRCEVATSLSQICTRLHPILYHRGVYVNDHSTRDRSQNQYNHRSVASSYPNIHLEPRNIH